MADLGGASEKEQRKSAQISPATHDLLEAFKEEAGKSYVWVIEHAVREYIERERAKPKPQ